MAEAEVNNPLVFSCRSCRSILGDSWHFVAANEEMNCVALDAVNEGATTVVKDDFITSNSGVDQGSTFFLVSCKRCSDVVGRIYKTTSSNLDQYRGCYTFDRESLDSYELGTGRSITAAQELGSLLPGPLVEGMGGGGNQKVVQDVAQMQEMLLLFNERLVQLEHAAATAGGAGGGGEMAPPPPSTGKRRR